MISEPLSTAEFHRRFPGLSSTAGSVAVAVSNKFFAGRSNRASRAIVLVHVNRLDLAGVIAAGVEAALRLAIDKDVEW